MQRLMTLAIAIVTITLIALPSTTSSQNPGNPAEFLPPRISRPEPPQNPNAQAKFRKVNNNIPNRYIVVLKDDVANDDSPREARLERVREIANSHALAHLGSVDYLYETALKGYAIELPNEAAAVAISNRPDVEWVEEDHDLELAQAPASPQPSPPWGLDAIDGTFPTAVPDAITKRTNGFYNFNATGAGVIAYVLDTGINTAHQEFQFPARATQAADCIRNNDCKTGPASPFLEGACAPGMPNPTNNDCFGHGTHVAGTIGGNTFGVAKAVTIRSVKVCVVPNVTTQNWDCPASTMIAGINWVTNDHVANPGPPKVANMSIAIPNTAAVNAIFNRTGINNAVNNSLNSGVTYVVAAGNGGVNALTYHPAEVERALTVGSVNWNGIRASNSNWGPGVDLFAPGVDVLSAQTGNNMGITGDCAIWDGSNTDRCWTSGTSMAAAHVSGAVAMYLQGRTALGGNVCATFPIHQSVLATTANANLSTCPDRVARFIKAIANLNRLTSSITVDPLLPSANRFLWNIFIPTNANPIDNQRFFVWTHYPDFLNRPEPDEGGLDHWTTNITGHCATNINQNNACTREWRMHTSRAFWVHQFPSLFNAAGTTNNTELVRQAYRTYLRREADASGLQHWVNDLNQYGNPANYDGVNHLIDAFLVAPEFRRRFGPS